MSNIVIDPSSGILEFNTGTAQGSSFDSSLLGASRLEFKNSGELSLTSLGTGVPEKFTIDGSNGRLFTVNNTVTGSIFSINDVAGLPIVEVFSDDVVVMGQFASDALVVSGTKVGVGTSLPAYQLDIQGDVGGTGIGDRITLGGTPYLLSGDSTAEIQNLDQVLEQGNTSSRDMQVGAITGSSLVIDTNTLYVDAPNNRVGINITAPAKELDVVGTVRAADSNGQYQLRPTQLITYGVDAILNAQSAGDDVILKTQGNPRLIATAEGDVGIGTTSPAQKLEVAGRVRATTDPTFEVYSSSSNRGGIQWSSNVTGTNIFAGGSSSSANVMTFQTNASERVRIDSSGNVGIGTTTPSHLLEIDGGTENAFIQLKSPNTKYVGIAFGDPQVATAGRIQYYHGDDSLQFDTTSKFTFEGGNIGIGTTSPSSLLSIQGQETHTTGTISYSDALVDIYNDWESNTDEKGAILTFSDNYYDGSNYIKTTRAAIKGGTDTVGNTADGFLAFYTDSVGANTANERMRIDHDGNVGIGITNPTDALEVKTNTDSSAIIGRAHIGAMGHADYAGFSHLDQNATNSYALLQSSAGTTYLNAPNGKRIYFLNNNTVVAELDASKFQLRDSKSLNLGTDNDFKLFHDGNNSVIENHSGDLYIRNYADDKSIIMLSDDGNGGLGEYFRLAGNLASTGGTKYTLWPDNSRAAFGTSQDLQLVHNGVSSFLSNYGGNLFIDNNTDNGFTDFRSDNGLGGLDTYLRINGTSHVVNFFKQADFADNVKATFGASQDLQMYHNGTNSEITHNNTGDLLFKTYVNNMQLINYATDGDITFRSDDGAGGTVEYFRVDGGDTNVTFSKNIKLGDDVKTIFGGGNDLQIYHDGSNSYIADGGAGSLYINSNALRVHSANGSHEMIKAVEGSAGGVYLYHNNSLKLSTTAGGVSVAGSVGVTNIVTNRIVKFNGSILDDSVMYDDGTNIGIGTTTPAYELHVSGDVGGTGIGDRITLNGTPYLLSGDSTAEIQNLDEVLQQGNTSTRSMDVGNITGTYLNIENGVSEGSALVRLHNTTNGAGAAIEFNDVGNGTSQNALLSFKHQDSKSQGGSCSFHFASPDQSDMVMVFGGDYTSRMAIKAATSPAKPAYSFYDDNDCGMNRMAANTLGLITSGVERVRVYEDGDFSVNTNDFYIDASANKVGIGTSTPTEGFTVYRAGNAKSLLTGSNVSIFDLRDPSSIGQLSTYNDGTFRIHSVENAGSEQLVLSGTSYVGVNTIPTSNFHVGGSARTDGSHTFFGDVTNADANGPSLAVLYGTYSSKTNVMRFRQGGSTANGVAFSLYDYDPSLFLTYNNTDPTIGIGTTNPAYTLDVTGTVGAFRFIQDGSSSSNFYSAALSRSSSSLSVPDVYDTNGYGLVLGASNSEDTLVIETGHKVMIRGGSDPDNNNGRADFAVGVGGSPVVSWRGQQVQIGGTDMNWAGKVYYDNNQFQMGAWASDVRIYTQDSSATARDIIFQTWNGSTTIEPMRILGEGRVGIGTDNPSAKLSIKDGSSAINIQEFSNGAAIFLDGADGDFVGGDYFHIIANGNSYLGLGGYGAGTTPLNVTNAGRVGIGTTSPTYKLHIDDNATSGAGLLVAGGGQGGNLASFVRDVGTTGPQINIHATNSDPSTTFVNSTKAYTIGLDQSSDAFVIANDTDLADSNTYNFVVDSAGNVGIGTLTPSYELHVSGDVGGTGAGDRITLNGTPYLLSGDSTAETQNLNQVLSEGNTSTLGMDVGNITADGLSVVSNDPIVAITDSNSTTRYAAVNFQTNGGNWILSNGSSTSTTASNFYVSRATDGTDHRLVLSRDNRSLGLYDSGGNIDINLAPSGDSYFNAGEVGIGTTSPSKKLHVNGSYKLGTNAYIQYDASYPYTITTANTAAVGNLIFSAGLGSAAYESKIELQGTNVATESAITLSTASSAKLTILNNGKVGIGTTAPSNVLHVKSTTLNNGAAVKIENTRDGGSDHGLEVVANGTTDSFAARIKQQGVGDILQVFDGNDEVFTILDGGNVGIGTTSPDYELHVVGTASFTDTVAGAYFEENASHASLKKFETGTILVMNEEGQLVPCSKADDTMVFGVSKHGYKQPIVMGAEPIKVTGPIKVGDFITTSEKEGHGKKSTQPYPFGMIIAQAMESGDGESHTIKAMIRKM